MAGHGKDRLRISQKVRYNQDHWSVKHCFFDAFSIPFRYMETYLSAYPGYYFTGDGARRDENGYWQITGRVDDVINITGHRLGTAEVV